MTEEAGYRIVHPDGSPDDRELLEDALLSQDIAPADVSVHYGAPGSAEVWLDRVGAAEVVIAGWGIPDRALVAFPRVRHIVFLGTGAADHINLPLAAERGIEVRTVQRYGDDSVAEHALALLLSSAREIPRLDASMRRGEWDPLGGALLRAKTLGVVGLGGIGRRMAELGRGIGMEVIGWNRSAELGARTEGTGTALAPLAELFARADAVSLHLALTAESRGLISSELIASLKPGAILVNTARAGVLDVGAAHAAARAGRIRYAADVFEPEPLAPDDPQRRTPNTVLTPHVAFDTPEATAALYSGAAAHIAAILAGEAGA